MANNEDRLSRKQASAYLRKMGCAATPQTMAIWAIHNNSGGGPPFDVYKSKGRRFVSYLRADLDEWAAKRLKRVP